MSAGRLLAGTEDGALSLEAHLSVHGPPGERDDLVEAVARSGLRGRGGASFPTAVKLQGAARHRGPRTVLVNGAEGEPLSAKDRTLMRVAPHLVLDGALVAARAIGARNVIVAVREDAIGALVAMQRAIDERRVERRVRVTAVPTAYLAGQEMALINYLDRGALLPRTVPPLPVQRGLRGRPTLVQNPETLAHIALIDRHGAEWFRAAGTADHPGTALITVAGAVREPGVIEIECGTLFADVVARAGGATEVLQAALVGGYHGVWVPAEGLPRLRLDDGALATWGGTMAAGVTVAVGSSACIPREVAGVMRWLAGQTAGQCGPCTHGMPAIARLTEQVADGTSPAGARAQLERWSTDLIGRGACHLPDGSVRFLASALRTFKGEFTDHARRGPCRHCRRPTFLSPAAPARRRVA